MTEPKDSLEQRARKVADQTLRKIYRWVEKEEKQIMVDALVQFARDYANEQMQDKDDFCEHCSGICDGGH